MAKQSVATSSPREGRTVPVIFQQHPDYPGGVLEYVTPTTAAVIRRMDALSETQRHDVLRVVHAAKAGQFNYSPAEIEAWTPEQRQAVIDSLPEVQS
jgi:hypothetical protein